MNEVIKTISRNWLDPNDEDVDSGITYSVGKNGVKSIEQCESCFHVYFESGAIISVTDVQYVNWIKKEEKNV